MFPSCTTSDVVVRKFWDTSAPLESTQVGSDGPRSVTSASGHTQPEGFIFDVFYKADLSAQPPVQICFIIGLCEIGF